MGGSGGDCERDLRKMKTWVRREKRPLDAADMGNLVGFHRKQLKSIQVFEEEGYHLAH